MFNDPSIDVSIDRQPEIKNNQTNYSTLKAETNSKQQQIAKDLYSWKNMEPGAAWNCDYGWDMVFYDVLCDAINPSQMNAQRIFLSLSRSLSHYFPLVK